MHVVFIDPYNLPLLVLTAGLNWPTFQNRQDVSRSLLFSHLGKEELVLSCRRRQNLYSIILVLSALVCAQKAKAKHFVPTLPLFLCKILGEKRRMSYCFSGCGGLNMYNTSRHDHFLWLKPLKMAPYFLKPIDLPTKSVHLSRNYLLSQPKNTVVLISSSHPRRYSKTEMFTSRQGLLQYVLSHQYN